MYPHQEHNDIHFQFCGTPLNTLEQAWKNDAEAFVALRNDLVPGHLIEATAMAMETFEVLNVNAAVTLSIQMCLLRTTEAVMKQTPLRVIASHPAALAQINQWKTGQNLDELEDPDGTSEAARKLAGGQLPDHTGVIGPAILETQFPQLLVTATGIQDKESNTTLFGQLQVTRRPSPVSSNVARDELEKVVEIASTLSGGSSAP